jgi:hypothetical protein
MRTSALLPALFVAASASGQGTTLYLGPSTAATGSASLFTSNNYLSNYGVVFTTGQTGPFSIDWVNIGLSTNQQTSGSASFNLALHDTSGTTAYSAAAGANQLAMDRVTFSMPTTISTTFLLELVAADIPNLSAYTMQSSTAYSLIIYNASSAIAIRRIQGLAQFTTNDYYTSDAGFGALNTLRNNIYYTNNGTNYPALDIAFGSSSPVPEPSTYGLILGGLALAGAAIRRRCKV